MKKIRVLMTTIPFNLFFIQRYQLEKLPTTRLALTSKLLKQTNNGTIITVIVIFRQLLTSASKFYYKIKSVKIEKVGSSVKNGLARTLAKPLRKLILVLSSINKIKLYAKTIKTILLLRCNRKR